MIARTLAQIVDVVDGTLHPADADAGLVVSGPVVTDSREAGAGSLYIARVGESADGHDFVPSAMAAGAVAAVTTRPIPGAVTVVVADTQEAFARLARHLVDTAADLEVVAVTGSSGKTSTKDILGQVLAAHGPTVAPEGSYNSEVGVPLTVCRIEHDTRYLVVEMGARGIGHIAYLTQIAPPRVGIVLNVGVAHVGEFGSVEAIAIAKRELVESLPPEGVAVLNADDPLVRAMADRTAAQVVLVGEAADAQVRAEDVTVDEQGRPSCTVVTDGERHELHLGLVGRHHIGNALAVIAAARACGIDVAAACQTLAEAVPVSRWRMEVTTRPDGVTVVNDAYNANPDSMRAALDSLALLGRGRRSWAVLGAMLELGADSEAMHAEIGSYAVSSGVDHLVVVGGPVAEPMATGGRTALAAGDGAAEIHRVDDRTQAAALLSSGLTPGDVVLFKSSRDAGLRWLGDEIAEAQVVR